MGRPSLAGPCVGVDVGATKVRAGLVDARGRVLGKLSSILLERRDLPMVVAAIGTVAAAVDPQSSAVSIGVAVAAQVDRHQGRVLYAPNLGWRDVPLARMVRRHTGRPVVLENDGRAATFGEWRYGNGQRARALFGLVVGTGVGGGFIESGRPIGGARDAAGDVGHLTVVSGGRRSHCPNRGCLEAYAGGRAIADRAAEALNGRSSAGQWLRTAGGPSPTAEVVFRGARQGDPRSVQLVDETFGFLASGAVSIVNAFNPDVMVLGGGILEHWPGIARRLQGEVRRRAQPPAAAAVRVRKGALGPSAPIVGAAAIAAEWHQRA